MKKSILNVLVLHSCRMAVKEDAVQQNITEMEKKNIGSLLALYLKPLTGGGAIVGGKVNWLVVGHTDIIRNDRILVSMSNKHYTNRSIRKFKKLSVNFVDRAMLPKADYVGSVSGVSVDKSHIASKYFQKYKPGTLHMIKSLALSDQMPLNLANKINNFIQ